MYACMFLLAALLDITLHTLRMRCVAQDLMLFTDLKLKCLHDKYLSSLTGS